MIRFLDGRDDGGNHGCEEISYKEVFGAVERRLARALRSTDPGKDRAQRTVAEADIT